MRRKRNGLEDNRIFFAPSSVLRHFVNLLLRFGIAPSPRSAKKLALIDAVSADEDEPSSIV